jgi:hypothetical protein
LGDELTYFVKHKRKGKKYYTENEVISILEVFIHNIYVQFGGTNCALLLADLFLCSYEAEFIQKLIKDKTYR